ncbi:MAG: hypothetical protein DRO67_01995 [Candidatus Asgardarchaeum californiense]|nr:MAG: hypothetical protein DRO67_01995 [Candidatus Asgardarchaeum californiense]
MIRARERINELLAEKRIAEKALTNYKNQKEKQERVLKDIDSVQKLFQSAVSLMYENLSIRLGEIITEGLTIVFPDSQYRFVIEFVERRGNVEADLYLEDSDGNKYHPLDAVGGGVSDIVCLLLRITYILLSQYDNFLAADEPLRFVDRKRIPDAAVFIKKVCEDFKLQLFVVSHIPELIEVSETVYTTEKRKGVSVTTKLKG